MLFRSNDTATTEIYTTEDTLSLHDALPIHQALHAGVAERVRARAWDDDAGLVQIVRGALRDSIVRDRNPGGTDAKEHVTRGGGGTVSLQVVDDGAAHQRR